MTSTQVNGSPSTTAYDDHIPVPKDGFVFYFAYGSNMSSQVLSGRRRVKPLVSYPAVLEDYVLGFNLRGLPYVEPGMATVAKVNTSMKVQAREALKSANITITPPSTPSSPSSTTEVVNGSIGTATANVAVVQNGNAKGGETAGNAAVSVSGPVSSEAAHAMRVSMGLHGVLHLISDHDWTIVKATEGVQIKGLGYQVIDVECQLYDGRKVKAVTLEASPWSTGSIWEFLPSKRYIDILRAGAKEHGLDPAYVAMLEAHPAYDPIGTAASIGRTAAAGAAATIALPLAPIILASAAMKSASKLMGFSSTTPQRPNQTTTSAAQTLQSTTPNGVVNKAQQEQTQATKDGGDAQQQQGEDNTETEMLPELTSASTDAAPVASRSNTATGAINGGGASKHADKAPPGHGVMVYLRNNVPPTVSALAMWGVFRGVWVVHDYVLGPVLGSGRHNNARLLKGAQLRK